MPVAIGGTSTTAEAMTTGVFASGGVEWGKGIVVAAAKLGVPTEVAEDDDEDDDEAAA